ncbi:MAG TPA: lipid-transfer protein [Actinomycetota bacterium]
MRDRAAIVGIGQTEFAKDIGRPEQRIALEAISAALDDSGVGAHEVDGLVKFSLENTMEVDIARNLGMQNLRFFADVAYGGGAGCGAVGHAAMAVASGQAEVVVVWRARNRGSGGRPWAKKGNRAGGEMQWFLPFGLSRPVDQIAMLARRHMIEYGSTSEQLGAVAVAFREHAQQNPAALMHGRPMTLEDYLASRWISEPLRLFDCCLETDGALAVVVTSAERARDLRRPAALVRGYAQGTGSEHLVMANYFTRDPLDSPGHHAARDLWRNAGIGPDEIDSAQMYDAFTPLILISLEAFGFAKPGEGGPFAAEGNLRLGGALPTNTSGGGLSEAYVHGMNLILEGARQIRGDSVNQVAGCETVMVSSGNGVPTSALVLRKDT